MDRLQKLEEALQIIIPMLRGEAASLDGRHYRVSNAVNSPAPVGRIPVMIGGGGERKTLRMVAQYADDTINAPANGHIPGRVALLGETAARVVS